MGKPEHLSRARRRIIAGTACAAVFLFGAILVLSLLSSQTPPPLVVLRRPFSPPLSLRERLDRRIPPNWSWARGIEHLALGRPKTINWSSATFRLDAANSVLFEATAGPPAAVEPAQGVAVWFLPGNQLTALRKLLEKAHLKAYQTTVSASDGQTAKIGLMEEAVITPGATCIPGMEASFSRATRSRKTDLFADVVVWGVATNYTQAGVSLVHTQTDLDVAVRLQVPQGRGVLLLKQGPGTDPQERAGFILDPL